MARRWSAAAKRHLLEGVGTCGISWFQRKANVPGDYPGAVRSRTAVYAAARRQNGPGGLTRGVDTLHRLAQRTGYGRGQILRARGALKQKWRRLGPRGAYLISDAQANEIMEWLKHDYWAPAQHLYCCLRCHGESRLHRARGLCSRCYYVYRRRCAEYGIPQPGAAQSALVATLAMGGGTGSELVLESMRERLSKGWALRDEDLLCLKRLTGSTGI